MSAEQIRVRVRWAPWPGGAYRCVQALPPDRPDLADMPGAMWLVDGETGKASELALYVFGQWGRWR